MDVVVGWRFLLLRLFLFVCVCVSLKRGVSTCLNVKKKKKAEERKKRVEANRLFFSALKNSGTRPSKQTFSRTKTVNIMQPNSS